MGKNITASVVVYNNERGELLKVIQSCLACELLTRLYLIDNSDYSLMGDELIADERIEYIYNGENIGFGKGHNKAIALIKNQSDYHVALNPDISFQPGVLETLCEQMEQHPDIGLMMPKITYEDGTTQRLCKLLPSPFHLFGRRFLGNFAWVRKIDSQYELGEFNYEYELDVPNLSGCFMFLRTSILRSLGGFDPRYFLYMEDLDLVRRIGSVARTVCFPHVEVMHSYKKGSYHKLHLMKIHIRSAICYFNKWGWFGDAERSFRNKKVMELIGIKNQERDKKISKLYGPDFSPSSYAAERSDVVTGADQENEGNNRISMR